MRWTKQKSEEAKALAIQLRTEGKTLDEIAEATGYSAGTVKVLLNKAGVNVRVFISEEDKEQIVKLHKDGLKAIDIAEKLGMKRNTVYGIITAKGLTTKRIVDTKRADDEMVEEIIAVKKPAPKTEKITHNGKRYTDITNMITAEYLEG